MNLTTSKSLNRKIAQISSRPERFFGYNELLLLNTKFNDNYTAHRLISLRNLRNHNHHQSLYHRLRNNQEQQTCKLHMQYRQSL